MHRQEVEAERVDVLDRHLGHAVLAARRPDTSSSPAPCSRRTCASSRFVSFTTVSSRRRASTASRQRSMPSSSSVAGSALVRAIRMQSRAVERGERGAHLLVVLLARQQAASSSSMSPSPRAAAPSRRPSAMRFAERYTASGPPKPSSMSAASGMRARLADAARDPLEVGEVGEAVVDHAVHRDRHLAAASASCRESRPSRRRAPRRSRRRRVPRRSDRSFRSGGSGICWPLRQVPLQVGHRQPGWRVRRRWP